MDCRWQNRQFWRKKVRQATLGAPWPEPREESGLQFAASGRFLSPVPMKGRSFQRLPLPPGRRRRGGGHRAARPIRHPRRAFPGLASRPARQDTGRPILPPSRSLATFRPRVSIRPHAPGPSPPSSPPRGGDWACVSPSPVSDLGARGPRPSPGEAGGSPWLRDHHAPASQAGNRPAPEACAGFCAQAVNNRGRGRGYDPETEKIQGFPGYPQDRAHRIAKAIQPLMASRFSSSASHSSSAAASWARVLPSSCIRRSKPTLSRA
jgi:hypothetical protein